MNEKQKVHGYITVELIKKHGRKDIRTENLLTDYGKEYIMANGIAPLLTAKTGMTSSTALAVINNIRPIGTVISSTNTMCGPYSIYYSDNYVDMSTMTNMLLNVELDSLYDSTRMFIPTAEQFKGAASQAAATAVNHGTVIDVGQSAKRKIVTQRYQYPADLAAEFNCIAMSTIDYIAQSGVITPNFRSVIPYVNSGTLINITAFSFDNCEADEIVFICSDGLAYKYNSNTGIITIVQVPSTTYTITSKTFVFIYKNHRYVVSFGTVPYVSPAVYNMSVHVYSIETSELVTTLINSETLSSTASGVAYINNKFYAIKDTGYYELIEDSNGILSSVASTATEMTDYPTSIHTAIVGNDTYGFVNISTTVDRTVRTTLLNNKLEAYGASFTRKGALFPIGILSMCDVGTDYPLRSWQQQSNGLRCYGNLLSYHMFEQSIRKNVGDELFVSYSYYVD